VTHPQPDPFRALRASDGPVDPDPAFAAALRARVERALLWEEPMTSTLTPPRTTPRMHTLTPYLAVVDARASIAFYVAAFGAVRRGDPHVMPDGRIGHVEVGIGDTVLMLADEFPEIGLRAPVGRGGASQSLRLETADPDGVVAAAVAAGAVLERPVTDAPYGRGGVVVDPDGHRWMVSREAPTAHPGDVVYASLWAPDAGRTRRFFDGVLGGLGALGTADGATPTLMCCYEVTDVDAAVVAVRAAGGTADDPRDEPHGRTADCVDDQGIPFALHTGYYPPLPESPLAYAELRVPDATRARAFYGTVLSWGFDPGGERGYWHPRRSDGEFPAPMFGLVGGAAEARVVPTFGVADVAAAVAAVRAAGGEAADGDPRGGTPCVDDQGAPFHLRP
jgi:uncharacterized glyoxalase superfamily protein PhnB